MKEVAGLRVLGEKEKKSMPITKVLLENRDLQRGGKDKEEDEESVAIFVAEAILPF